MSYQLIQDPTLRGLGATPNIPVGGLLQSGGGVSNLVHGGTSSIYSRESERTDIFGNSMPRNDKTYGNMYSTGPSYLENVDIWTPEKKNELSDYPYAWDHANSESKYYPEGIANNSMYRSSSTSYIPRQQYQAQSPRENFVPMEDFSQNIEQQTTPIEKIQRPSIFVIFIILAILIIAIEFWSGAFSIFLKQYVLKKDKLTVWNYTILAIIMSSLFFAIIYFGNYNFDWFN